MKGERPRAGLWWLAWMAAGTAFFFAFAHGLS